MDTKDSEQVGKSLLSSLDTFKQYRKRPTKVRAARVTQTVDIQTLGGVKTGYPGDYIVVGSDGEVSVLAGYSFESTYDEVKEG